MLAKEAGLRRGDAEAPGGRRACRPRVLNAGERGVRARLAGRTPEVTRVEGGGGRPERGGSPAARPPLGYAAGMRPTAAQMAASLGLEPHPEGGFYLETYRAAQTLQTPRGERPASTAIIFLVTEGSVSKLHRLTSDELWVFQGGLPLEIVTIAPDGGLQRRVLGDLEEIVRSRVPGDEPTAEFPVGLPEGSLRLAVAGAGAGRQLAGRPPRGRPAPAGRVRLGARELRRHARVRLRRLRARRAGRAARGVPRPLERSSASSRDAGGRRRSAFGRCRRPVRAAWYARPDHDDRG